VWREAARLEMLAATLARGEYAEAERAARRLLRARGSGLFSPQAERMLMEALYWQAEDRELLRRLAALPPESRDAELNLFAAVAACRLELPDWPEHFRRLFFQEAAGPVHIRAFSFLELEQRPARFTAPVWEYFTAKTLLYGGRTEEAVGLLEKALPALGAARFAPERLIGELGAAYFAAGDLRGGAEYFLDLAAGTAEELPAGAELAAVEMAGRLLRKAGDDSRAARLLDRVSAESRDPQQRDRAAWFVLDMAFKNGGWRPELAARAPGWVDAGYFSDLLHRQAGDSLAAGAWEDLRLLYELSSRHGPAGVRVRLAYLLGRGVQLGLARLPGLQAESLLAAAAEEGGYYALLACAAGGAAVRDAAPCGERLPPAGDAGGDGPPVWQSFPDAEMSPQDMLVSGFFHYGLPLLGYERILADPDRASEGLLFNAALWLRQQGHVLESIRLAALLAGRGAPRRSELLYPRAFADELEARARTAGLDAALVYALVREESHFDPGIVSAAGAVGLTQLMPETAADLVRWLRLADSVSGEEMKLRLTDPAFNLQLGVYHLTRLLARVEESPALALMAYNAGLARLRSWQRQLAGLPADLMTEALPFPETRGYVQKIVVSAVAYASLYAGSPPAETVYAIFTDLKGKQP
jgi:hypothetical protein